MATYQRWKLQYSGVKKDAQEYVTKQHRKGKVASDIKDIFNADDRAHAEERLKDFVKIYGESQPRLAAWPEENLPEGFAVFAFPEAQLIEMKPKSQNQTSSEKVISHFYRKNLRGPMLSGPRAMVSWY